MIVGIPKESWRDERRVALTPAGVYSLEKAGHAVLVQSTAGVGSGFSEAANNRRLELQMRLTF